MKCGNMSKIKKAKKIKFIHNKPQDYRIYPVNGVWGGVSGRGDLICNFFVEHHEVPKEEVFSIEEDGSLRDINKKPKEEARAIRDLQVGILVNREQAVSIANWMLEKVKEFEKITKEELKK